MQFIDVRDVAEWSVRGAEAKLTGNLNAKGLADTAAVTRAQLRPAHFSPAGHDGRRHAGLAGDTTRNATDESESRVDAGARPHGARAAGLALPPRRSRPYGGALLPLPPLPRLPLIPVE